MVRKAGLLVLVFGLIATAGMSHAETVDASWSLPTTYNDGTAIPSSVQASIVTTVYIGTGLTGPWEAVGTSSSGATSLTGLSLDLKRGQRYYFTVTAMLNGQTSAYSPAIVYCKACSNPGHPKNPKIIFK